MYKIYINDKLLVILKKEDLILFKTKFDVIDYKSIPLLIDNKIPSTGTKGWAVFSPDPKKVMNSLLREFKFIEAAGGVVQNNAHEYLFIFRRNKWDLPKGKVDEGESIEEAAIREVKEECGIHNLEIQKKLAETWHFYIEREQPILKKTYWFNMWSDDKEVTPQLEENITKAIWLSKENFSLIRKNTYPSIIDLIDLITS